MLISFVSRSGMSPIIPRSLRGLLGRPSLPRPTPAETGLLPAPTVPAIAVTVPAVTVATPASPRRSVALLPMSAATNTQFDAAFVAMIAALETFLPPPVAGMPQPSVIAVSATERSVGLGNIRGEELRGDIGPVELKGGRIDAVVRFTVWATAPGDVNTALQDLSRRLLADRDRLKSSGFLRVAMMSASEAENVTAVAANAWRETAEFGVLFEYHFVESDAGGLIARIPIDMKEQFDEKTVVTDEMARWDDEAALPLVVRGPKAIAGLSTLSFVSGASPSGTITLLRTFDGAPGPPVDHATLAAFLAGVATERHARLVFASLTDLLAALDKAGDPLMLGADSYQSREARFATPLALPSVSDRFEITHQHLKFDQIAVVYVRATR
jgi:hypothetical protein